MRMTTVFGGVVGVVGLLAFATQARAQSAADEYSAIVLDQTGSMHVAGQDHGNIPGSTTSPSTEMFDNAINAAINWITKDRAAIAASGAAHRRAYAIYTFKDDNCCGGSQAGLKKIWPLPTPTVSVGCNPGIDLSQTEAGTQFCIFDADQTDSYDSLIGVLNSLRITSGDPNNLLNVINTGAQPKGGASFDTALYGLGPNTPLANALCDAAERLVLTSAVKNVTFILETDGGENFSPFQPFHACSGTAGGLASGVTTFPKATADWGLPVGSWQANAMRRLTRFIPFPALAGGPINNDPRDLTAIAAGPIRTPPDDVLANSKWRIDVHFSICDPALFPSSPPPCTVTPTAAFAAPLTITTAIAGGDTMKLAKSPPPPATTKVLTPAAAALVAVSSTQTQSIAATELAFFSALGKVNAKSTFRQFARDPRAAAAVHVPRIAGDVDDSGCTDRADLSIVTQSDVYYSQAIQPNQIGIRADLNGDQWVNRLDAQIVLNNWGRGCINNPGPKPKLKF